MLSVKNLTKIYKTKGGADVRALDGVSVDFPEKGMVFLLGRSGSGKSTLLNVAGGLDVPDGGEVIIKGKSSKEFSATDFDSYRNTFVGFIFQEYNILNEFNVEQNIALALQLQGKKNDKQAIQNLLQQVDLEKMGKRKPNTLSGGQKQRIAIARALIKEPEIIMADEPTGALDSRTGKQVFDTLKKLSESKLVIVVSHDREFAEIYGDRIIELKDGKIISDVSKTLVPFESGSENGNVKFVGDSTVTVDDVSKITEEDLRSILTKMKKSGKEGIITFGEKEVQVTKRACKITEAGDKETFTDTDLEAARQQFQKTADQKPKFIKSKLPGGHALKMGLSGLRLKPIRLIFTVLLSVVAFTMFGVVATMMNFDPAFSVGKALEGSHYDHIALSKKYDFTNVNYGLSADGTKTNESEYKSTGSAQFGVAELAELNSRAKAQGLNFAGVYRYYTMSEYGYPLETRFSIENYSGVLDSSYYTKEIGGFTDCGTEFLAKNNFTVEAGRYPTADNEVMITTYMFEMFSRYGYCNVDSTDRLESEADSSVSNAATFLSGSPKYLLVKNTNSNVSKKLKIVGIVNTGSINPVYDFLKPTDNASASSSSQNESLEQKALKSEFEDYLEYSFFNLLFVSDNFYEANRNFAGYTSQKYLQSVWAEGVSVDDGGENYNSAISVLTEKCIPASDPSAFRFMKITASGISAPTSNVSIADNEFYLCFDSNCFLRNIFFFVVNNTNYFTVLHPADSAEATRLSNIFNYYNSITMWDPNSGTEIPNPDYLHEFTAEEISLIWNAVKWFANDATVENSNNYNSTYPENNTWISEEFDRIKEEFVQTLRLKNTKNASKELTLAGFVLIDSSYNYWSEKSLFLPSSVVSSLSIQEKGEQITWVNEVKTDYQAPADARYDFIITNSNNEVAKTKFMLNEACTVTAATYKMTNNIFTGADFMTSLISDLKTAFSIIAGVVGGLAALMLFNFISVSISVKKKEIGVLRAVGARGIDVFRIFFSEGGFIAIICFILSAIASYYVCEIINSEALDSAIALKLLEYGPLEVGLIFAISFAVSLIATVIPVSIAAKKPPVDSIRAL